MKNLFLNPDDTILLIIDIQERLWSAMYNKKEIEKNAGVLAGLAIKTDIPIIYTEQYKKGIGPTIKTIDEKVVDVQGIEKLCFNCFDSGDFKDRIFSSERKTLLICGIEAHICILQTALAALEKGFAVHIAADATGSRTDRNHNIGIGRMRDAGCIITSTEAAIFEVIKEAGTPLFKDMLALIK